MARICRPEGRVIIIEMHPALLLQGISARFHDPKTGRDIRPRSVGHRISDFVMAAVRAGLAVEEMQEFFDQDGNAAWPLLLTMKFRPLNQYSVFSLRSSMFSPPLLGYP